MSAALTLQAVTHRFAFKEVVQGIHLRVQAGECVALAAELLYGCRELLTDRAVAEMVSELVLMADAMQLGTTLTNPEQRIAAHQVRINQLREQLPTSGEAADG